MQLLRVKPSYCNIGSRLAGARVYLMESIPPSHASTDRYYRTRYRHATAAASASRSIFVVQIVAPTTAATTAAAATTLLSSRSSRFLLRVVVAAAASARVASCLLISRRFREIIGTTLRSVKVQLRLLLLLDYSASQGRLSLSRSPQLYELEVIPAHVVQQCQRWGGWVAVLLLCRKVQQVVRTKIDCDSHSFPRFHFARNR